uniref:ATP synthase F0 subunit 8 n=1 Tax=Agonoscena pistaciae TaxID=1635299 RepID=A0A8F2TA50_9HEMI|nr:ATP synthase F0 subunit 8 [Agonoscena pistaciae]
MPQMAPLPWILLLTISLLSLIFTSTMIYFSIFFQALEITDKKSVKLNKLMW